MKPCGCPDTCSCRCRRAGACPCRRKCGCFGAESCRRCIPSAGLWLTLGAVSVLAAVSEGARRAGSRSEHPWYAFSRWQSSDYTDRAAARTLSGVMGYDVPSRYTEAYADALALDEAIEDAIVARYGHPMEE